MEAAMTSWGQKLEVSYSRAATTEEVSSLSGLQLPKLSPLQLFVPPPWSLAVYRKRTVHSQLPAPFEL